MTAVRVDGDGERYKFAYFLGKNNSFARPAREFFTFVHFFTVISKQREIAKFEVLRRTSALDDKVLCPPLN